VSVEVRWFDENRTALVYDFQGEWTWSEMFVAIDEAVKLLDSVQHHVNIVVDLRGSYCVPPVAPQALARIAYAPTMQHPNTNILIVIGLSGFLQTLYEIFRRLYPHAAQRYREARTQEELLALLSAFTG
jgi:hypothetical protein